MKGEPMYKTICFQSTDEFALDLRIAAAKQNQTKSAFIRDAIRHYIAWLDTKQGYSPKD